MVFASSWVELAEFCLRHPGSPALIDPGFAATEDPASTDLTWASAQDWSSTPLIHFAGGAGDQQRLEIVNLPFAAHLRPGVDDDPAAIDATILRCIDIGRVNNLIDRVKQRGDPFAWKLCRYVLDNAFGASSVRRIATEFKLTVRALQRRCAAVGIPRPKRLMSLARIYTVERLAEWSHQKAGNVALVLGFSDYSNYRRMKRQLLEGTPGRGDAGHLEEVIIRTLLSPSPSPAR